VRFVLVSFIRLIRDAIRQWRINRLSREAAALAFFLALSLAPLLVILTEIVGLVVGKQSAEADILAPMKQLLGAHAAGAMRGLAAGLTRRTATALPSVASVILILVGAAGAFEQIKDALNAVWKSPSHLRGGLVSIIRKRFLSVVLVAGSALLVLVLLAATTVVAEANHYVTGFAPAIGRSLSVANGFVSLAAMTLLFGVTFRVLPDAAVKWSDVWFGAALTAILFILGQFVIAFFLARSGLETAYGRATAMVVVLVWLYYSAQIYVFGAAFTRAYAVRFGSRSRQNADVVQNKS